MSDREAVEAFLREIKRLIRAGAWTFIEREKNIKGLALLGLTISLAKAEVLSLSYKHYDRGPLPDQDRVWNGEIWEFVKDIDGLPVYIKLKIDRRGCVCIGFHPSKGPKTLPFQD